jgi:hypothetical protein
MAPTLAARRLFSRRAELRSAYKGTTLVSFPRNDSGARPLRTASVEPAETLAWPVLASLPRVGIQCEPLRAATPMAVGMANSPESPGASPALRIATLAEAPEEFEHLAASEPSSVRDAFAFQTFLDQPQVTVRGYDWRFADSHQEVGKPSGIGAPPRTHYRIDAGNPRSSEPAAVKSSSRPAASASQTLSARMFQIHAAAAPHAGLLMTLVLAASVGLLCWLTMGRSNSALNYDQVLDDAAGWPAESASTRLPARAAGLNGAPDQFTPEFAWRKTPIDHVAAAPPMTDGGTEELRPSPGADLESNDVAAMTAPQLELSEPPATTPADAASAEVASPSSATEVAASTTAPTAAAAPAQAATSEVTEAAPSPEPITPTPHGHAFPTTPYGAFNYFAQPAPTSPPAARSAEAPAAPAATR